MSARAEGDELLALDARTVVDSEASVANARLDRRLLTPNAIYAYWQTLLPLVLFAACLYVARQVTSPWAVAGLVVLNGVVLFRIYFPLHECTHYNFFSTRFENRLFGYLTAAILATPFSEFRRQHIVHHRVFGTREDPGAVDYYVRFSTRAQLLRHLLLPLLGGNLWVKVLDYWRGLAGRHTGRAAKAQAGKGGERIFGYAVVAVVHAGMLVVLSHGLTPSELWRYPVFVLVPGATIFLFLSRLRMFLEHSSINYDELDYLSAPRPYARTIYASPVERLLICGVNFNYHYEHHLHPAVPACRLPEFHQRVTRPDLDPQHIRATYAATFGELWVRLGSQSRESR